MTAAYDDDLAFIHAAGFGQLAAAATAAMIPELRARGVRSVVDVGCGAGVSTRALVDAGFVVIGIEPSAALAAIARTTAPGAEIRQDSVYDVPLPPCDAILAIGEVLSYHAPEADVGERLGALFGAARRALRRGGLLAFDVIVAGAPPLDARRWASGDDWAVLSETREDRATGRLTRAIETFRREDDGRYRRGRELHHGRVLEPARVRGWLEAADFEVVTEPAYGPHALAQRRLAFLATVR